MISTIEHFSKDVTDFPTAKLALIVLTRMVTAWGGPDLPGQSSTVSTGDAPVAQPSLPGFDRFMMERFSPLCWALPSDATFNPKDAQGRQVLGEAAGLQKAIYAKTGQAYVTWLRDVELRGMGMDEATTNEYLNALLTFDPKRFRKFFQVSLCLADGQIVSSGTNQPGRILYRRAIGDLGGVRSSSERRRGARCIWSAFGRYHRLPRERRISLHMTRML